MTFVTSSFPSLADSAPEGLSPHVHKRSKVHVEDGVPKGTPAAQKRLGSEVEYEEIESARWEDQGGAHVDLINRVSRDDGQRLSLVQTHIGKAESHFANSDIDRAVEELFAAGKRCRTHQTLVHNSINSAIAHLTTLESRAAHPHPKALSLVRLRNTLSI